jgi:hypothetical protein
MTVSSRANKPTLLATRPHVVSNGMDAPALEGIKSAKVEVSTTT